MDSSKNNFESFDDNQNELPEGFGWEDMKEGVYEKMPTKKRRRRVAAWWWFGAAGVLALSFAIALSQYDQATSYTTNSDQNSTSSVVTQSEKLTSTSPTEQTENLEVTRLPMRTTSVAYASETPILSNASDDLPKSPSEGESNINQFRNEKGETSMSYSSSKSVDLPAREGRSSTTSEAGDRLATIEGESSRNTSRSSAAGESSVPNTQQGNSPKVEANFKVANQQQSGQAPESAAPQVIHSATTAFLTTNILSIESSGQAYNADILLKDVTAPEIQSLQTNNLLQLPHQILHKILDNKTTTPVGNFFHLESPLLVTTSSNNSINAPYLSPWYATGLGIGYQRQVESGFGFSVHYSFDELNQKFSFTDRDTITGSNLVTQTVNYVSASNLSPLTSSSTNVPEQFNRRRNVVSYNEFSFHHLSAFVHYAAPLNLRNNLDFGLGAGIQYLADAEGIRLDENFELIDLSETFKSDDRGFVSMNGRVVLITEVSPRLSWANGLVYRLRFGESLPSSVGLMSGARWRF